MSTGHVVVFPLVFDCDAGGSLLETNSALIRYSRKTWLPGYESVTRRDLLEDQLHDPKWTDTCYMDAVIGIDADSVSNIHTRCIPLVGMVRICIFFFELGDKGEGPSTATVKPLITHTCWETC